MLLVMLKTKFQKFYINEIVRFFSSITNYDRSVNNPAKKVIV